MRGAHEEVVLYEFEVDGQCLWGRGGRVEKSDEVIRDDER